MTGADDIALDEPLDEGFLSDGGAEGLGMDRTLEWLDERGLLPLDSLDGEIKVCLLYGV